MTDYTEAQCHMVSAMQTAESLVMLARYINLSLEAPTETVASLLDQIAQLHFLIGEDIEAARASVVVSRRAGLRLV